MAQCKGLQIPTAVGSNPTLTSILPSDVTDSMSVSDPDRQSSNTWKVDNLDCAYTGQIIFPDTASTVTKSCIANPKL